MSICIVLIYGWKMSCDVENDIFVESDQYLFIKCNYTDNEITRLSEVRADNRLEAILVVLTVLKNRNKK